MKATAIPGQALPCSDTMAQTRAPPEVQCQTRVRRDGAWHGGGGRAGGRAGGGGGSPNGEEADHDVRTLCQRGAMLLDALEELRGGLGGGGLHNWLLGGTVIIHTASVLWSEGYATNNPDGVRCIHPSLGIHIYSPVS